MDLASKQTLSFSFFQLLYVALNIQNLNLVHLSFPWSGVWLRVMALRFHSAESKKALTSSKGVVFRP